MSAYSRILCVVGALAVSTILSQAAQAQGLVRDPAAEEAFQAGTKLLEEQKWDEAITAFSKATELDKTYGEAYLGSAEANRELEDFVAALEDYKTALTIDPNSAKAFNGRGICYRELQQYELALSDFNNAAQQDRRDPEIAANLGDMYVNHAQDPVSGLRVLDKAIELDPKNAEVFRNRGLAHAQLRHFDEAEADLAQSVKLKDDDYESYSMQANVFLFQDKPEKLPLAVEALSQAIKHYKPEETSDPKTYVQGYLLRSDASLKIARNPKTPAAERTKLYKSVIADTEAILAENPDAYPMSGQAHFRKGVALRLQNLYGEAIKAFTDAIQAIPAGETGAYAAEAYLKRGICWHMQGENRLARGDLEQAASLEYTDPLPHLWIGFTFAEEEDFRAAIDSYGEAISKNPNFALPYVNRGLAYVQLNEYQRAADNFNEAIRVDPANAEHFIKRGDAYMLLEEFEKAYNSFHLATLNDDKNATAFHMAAESLKALGRDSLAGQYESRAQALKGMNN